MFTSVQNAGEAFTESLIRSWDSVAWFIPGFVAAIVIFIIGWILASLVHKLIMTVFKVAKVDSALRAAGVEELIKHSGHNLNSGWFIGELVKWFIMFVFLVASFDILKLTKVNEFLSSVIDYIPKVVIAVVILMVAAIVADALKKIVIGSARALSATSANFLGSVTKWAIWIFAVLAAVYHLGIVPELINTLLMGVVAAFALATGLAFGLGGKDTATEILKKISKEISE